jgi:hypothetical protein
VQFFTDAITDRLDNAVYAPVLARESRIRAGLADMLDWLLDQHRQSWGAAQ